MRVKIVYGYRGALTGEIYWPPESIQECDDSLGLELIADGRAVRVDNDGDRDTEDAPPADDRVMHKAIVAKKK